MTSYIRTDDHLTIVFDDGVSATVYATAPKYKAIVLALKDKDYDYARELALPVEQVKAQLFDTFGINEDQVIIEHGIVKYEGKEMDNTLTRRMLQMLDEGFDIAPLKLFLVNLQQNPSYRAVNELYSFLEKGNLPITEDGYFLAYKKVRADYRDVHSGKFDNSVGQVVQMPRNEVDEDSRNECSNGLHFCSKDYLSNFGGEHIMIVKINPADVVAIPADYNGSKGRTCRYLVIGELEAEGKLEGLFRDTGTRPAPGAVTRLAEDWLSEDEDDDDVFHIDDDEDDVTDSAFVGIPAKDSVTIPRDVALEIAREMELDTNEEDLEPVVAFTHNPNGLDARFAWNSADGGIAIMKFDDIANAASWAGVSVSAIRRVLRGERKKTGGYQWKRFVVGDSTTFTGS